jgi:hypothetical protein
MDVFTLAAKVVEALEAENVPYMVVGAMSVSVFGIPRATKDVDIVVSLETRKPLHGVERRLKDVLVFDPQITFETITGSLRHILNSKTNPPIVVELFELSDDPFVQTRFARRRQEYSAQLQRKAWMPTPEDVIVQKLRWARHKDIEDAGSVLAVRGPVNLDMTYIEHWCALHGTGERLREILDSIPADLKT